MAEDARRYRFGPLERRGLVGSLRPAQVFVIAGSLGGGVILMRALPGVGFALALALVLAALSFCFWPIAGRAAEEWLPVAGRFATETRARSPPPPLGRAAGRRQSRRRRTSRGGRLPPCGGGRAGAARRAASTATRSAWSRIAAPAPTPRSSP